MTDNIDPEKFYEMQMLEEQIKNTQQMLENASEQLNTVRSTVLALQEFDKLKGEEEFLFPLANGILATGKLESKRLLVNVGAGVVKEKSIIATIKSLQEQEEEIMKFLQKIEMQYSELVNKIESYKDIRQKR